jgi:hypothetical protein
MLIDIDVHHLARVAQSLSEMNRLIQQGSKSFPHLCRIFKEHKNNCCKLADVVSDARKVIIGQEGGECKESNVQVGKV